MRRGFGLRQSVRRRLGLGSKHSWRCYVGRRCRRGGESLYRTGMPGLWRTGALTSDSRSSRFFAALFSWPGIRWRKKNRLSSLQLRRRKIRACLIGPEGDPAGIRGMKDVAKALKAIKDKSATFISRGDNSGTHMRELMLWNKDVGINIQELDGPWYKPIERGMNAHAPYSTRPPAAMHSPTATLGFLSKTRATFKSWWKATDACSISTPSFW
jgi:hypothetical protein